MKKLVTLICAIAIGTMSFAQKDEIKAIEKALKKNNFTEAKSNVTAAESLISNMDEKTKAKFYLLKARAFYQNGNSTETDFNASVESLDNFTLLDSNKGKSKYIQEVSELKSKMLESVLSKTDQALKNKNFKEASKGFKKAYDLSKKDTLFLYNAAQTAVRDKDYDTSLKQYLKLKELGYTGIKLSHYATNVESDVEELFPTKDARDLSVKIKLHKNPRSEVSKSKQAEIVKNIAIIYVSQNKKDKALAAIEEAKKTIKNDYNLLISEGNIYIQLGDEEKASELFKKALSMQPENPNLNFNIGVVSMNADLSEDAKKYFNKALSLKPDFANAALNLSTIEINEGNKINDEMNKLGTSSADNKRYDELKEEKNKLFRKGATVLEVFIKNNPETKNLDVLNQLKNIYSFIGEMDKYKSLKKTISDIEAGN